MNERMKELMIEAGYAAPELATRAQKLAELIVQECVGQCEKIAAHANKMAKSQFVTEEGRLLHEGMWGGATNCGAWIKKHFGVEE